MKPSHGLTTIRTEGGLLPADLLARVAQGDSQLLGLHPEAYHLAPTERLNEAVNRSWNRLAGAWEGFATALEALPADDRTATEVTRRRFSLVLFQELGFGQLQPARAVAIETKSYPVSHAWGAVPIHLPGARVDLDRRTPGVAGAAAMSPHGLVQELLNRSEERLWGLVCNGLRLRLLRDNASLTRQAYLEFDLEAMFAGQVYADFVVLWLVCHQSRFEGEPAERCLLEQWVADVAQRGTRALDQLRVGVERAITELGAGFLAQRANAGLRQRLRSGELTTQDYYRQLLRLVYRLLFVFVAESRDLLLDPAAGPVAAERYRHFYALDRVRRLADRQRGGPHGDLWAGLQAVFAGLSHPDGLPALALPSLGSFLWSDRATPDLDKSGLANQHLLEAVRALSSVTDSKVTRVVDYRNLGSEELGSIYESLLELHARMNVDAATFALSVGGGNERKTTGSYYTPTSLITELLNSALDPVLTEAAARPDAEAAILALKVLDPACGSGHFLIAAAHRIARRLASVRTGEGEPSPAAVRSALRDVVGHCVYGIDQNKMAVELCKVSLWMEAIEPGKPLSFLDQRIACGNALLGATPALLDAGVPDAAFKPLTGDDKAAVTALKKRNRQEREGQGLLAFGPSAADLQAPLVAGTVAVDAMPDADAAAVRAKEARWRELVESPEARHARLVADAWCAAFVVPKVKGGVAITDGVVRQLRAAPGATGAPAVAAEVERLARGYGFLHWHLAFPQVFAVPAGGEEPDNPATGWSGGFDVVLGNPPWERVKLAEKEFFAVLAPEIAEAANAAARRRMIAALPEDDLALHGGYLDALRHADGESHFLRSTGRFPLCGRGDVNTYAVFAEAMRAGVGPTGRAGIIVPTGIATDDTTKHFFADLVGQRSLASLFDFENAQPLFPGVHRSYKFCLLTMAGRGRPVGAAQFVFFARSTADLADPERRFTLSPEDFALLNPNTRTCPVFRSRRDAELTKAIYRRIPVLIDESKPDGNPWGVRFLRMMDMSNDSHLFRTRHQLEADGWVLVGNVFHKGAESYVPLYEAKLFHHFDHRWATYDGDSVRDVTPAEKAVPTCVVQPRYWVPCHEAEASLGGGLRWMLAFRDIARSTDERTVIAGLLPPVAAGNNSPLLMTKEVHRPFLSASLSSLALDFVARFKAGGTHLNFFIAEQLPVLPPHSYDCAAPWECAVLVAEWIRARVLELSYTAWDLQPFARDLGYNGPPFRWDPERRALLRAELDACFFHLYGIERDDVDYIMETFPIVKRKDVAAHREYRTKRLILEVYDAMAKAIETGEPYQTILDPPPADPSCAHLESTRPAWAE